MNNLLKGTIILISMVVILGVGIGYLIMIDPTKEQRAIFSLVFDEFKQVAGDLEKAFKKDEALPLSRKSVTGHYRDNNGKKVALQLNVVVEADKMVVDFVNKSGEKVSVEFEPIVKVHKQSKKTSIKWICSGGTMLLRYRSEPCRTLKGIDLKRL